MFKKYSISGVSNPIWQIVEPVILKTWADGMRKASYPQLYLIHFMALLLSAIMFLGGFLLTEFWLLFPWLLPKMEILMLNYHQYLLGISSLLMAGVGFILFGNKSNPSWL